jgi:hypothetical protein
MSSKLNKTSTKAAVAADTNTFSYTELVRTLYTPGTDTIGKADDFRSTNVTGKIHDISSVSPDDTFDTPVSVIVAHSVGELNQPSIQNLIATQSVKPVVLLMNTAETDVPPYQNYSVRKNGDVFMYIPTA